MEDMKQQPEGAGRRLYVSREGLGKGISWVDEECNNGRHGGDLVQQLKPLRPQLHAQVGHAREVAAWPGEAGDQGRRQ